MKKLLTILFLLGFILTGSISVNAEETTTTENETEVVNETTEEIELDPGIKADSPFYFLDKLFEEIHLGLTSDEAKKAEILLKIAEERMSELNHLPDEKIGEHVDDLLDEYNNRLNQANERINDLILEQKLPEKAKNKLQKRLNHTVDVSHALKNKVKEKISDEVKNKINEIKNKTFLTALASGMTEDEINHLKDQGYGYGEILKLNALSIITGQTIEELKLLDIYDDLGEIDFSKVASELGITEEDVMNQIKEYRDTVKDEIKERGKGKDIAEEKKEEIEERQERIRNRFQNRINERLQERRSELNTHLERNINLHLQILDVLIEQGIITNDEKQIILDEINEIKEEIIAKIQDNELNRNDYEQMRLEIAQFIQTELQEKLQTVDPTQIDSSQMSEEQMEVLNYLLGHPQEVITDAFENILTNLEERGITLNDEQIQLITERINVAIENNEFDVQDYDEILNQISEIIKDDLDLERDIFENINQFKERYRQRKQENDDNVSFNQEIIDLFNDTVNDLNLEQWNHLSEEQQEKIQNNILQELDLSLSQDDLINIIQTLLTEELEDIFDEEENQQTINREVIDLFNDTVNNLNLVIWNHLSPERQDEIRDEILEELDLSLSQEEIRTQITTMIMNLFQTPNQENSQSR